MACMLLIWTPECQVGLLWRGWSKWARSSLQWTRLAPETTQPSRGVYTPCYNDMTTFLDNMPLTVIDAWQGNVPEMSHILGHIQCICFPLENVRKLQLGKQMEIAYRSLKPQVLNLPWFLFSVFFLYFCELRPIMPCLTAAYLHHGEFKLDKPGR